MKFKMGSWRVKGGQGVASFVNPGCFFSLDMCHLFTYGVEGGLSLKQVTGPPNQDAELSLLSLYRYLQPKTAFCPLFTCDSPLL